MIGDGECVCQELCSSSKCKEKAIKVYKDTLKSFGKNTRRKVEFLISLNDFIHRGIVKEINFAKMDLQKAGCNQVMISMTGKTPEGKMVEIQVDFKNKLHLY